MLASITPLTSGSWILILNTALLLLGFLALGKAIGIKTVYCSMLYSVLTALLERVIPIATTLTAQPCMELVYAMIFTSIGSAIIFHAGGSSGGTDIVALILKKYTKTDVGKALLITDFAVAVSSFGMFGIQVGLFSLAGLFAKAFIVDGVIENLNVCKYFIVLKKQEQNFRLYHGRTAPWSYNA